MVAMARYSTYVESVQPLRPFSALGNKHTFKELIVARVS